MNCSVRQTSVGMIVGVLAVTLSCPAADPGSTPQADFDAVFGAEAKRVAASKNLGDHAAFAAKLLATARRTSDTPDFQVLLADKAFQFGLKAPAAYATCSEALDLLQEIAPERKVQWLSQRCQLLKARGVASRGEAVYEAALEYLDALMVYAEEAARAGKYKEAEEAYQAAIAMARKLESPRREEAQAGLPWVAALAEAHRKGDVLKARVAKNPNDLAARTALVHFLLAEMDSPTEAAKALTNDMDETLRTYVPLASKRIEDLPLEACLELGQWYAKALLQDATSWGQANVLERAKGYTRHFLSARETKDVTWLKAKNILGEVEAKLAKLPRHGKPATASGPAMSLARGLVLHLPMDRIERGFTPDAGPRGLHARATGSLRVARGRVGGGGQFDGKNDHLVVSDNAALNPMAAISLTAWFKADGWDGNSRIVQKGYGDNQYRLLRENGSMKFHVAGVTEGVVACDAPAPGGWHHVAGVYDGKSIKLYMDGKEMASKPATGRIAVTRDPLFVATKSSNAIGSDHFRGALDEIRLYNRALTPKEVEILALVSAETKP